MPQTGTSEGHAHLYEDGGTRTTVYEDHWHRIRHGHQVTGPAIPVGSEKAEPEGHQHTVES